MIRNQSHKKMNLNGRRIIGRLRCVAAIRHCRDRRKHQAYPSAPIPARMFVEAEIVGAHHALRPSRYASMMRRIRSDTLMPSRAASAVRYSNCGLVSVTDWRTVLLMRSLYAPHSRICQAESVLLAQHPAFPRRLKATVPSRRF